MSKEFVRKDGRGPLDLRPVTMEVGLLSNADGSALVAFGNTRVIAAVFGPREVHPKHLAQPDRAIIRCAYRMAPFSTHTRKSPAPTRREIELSKVIREAFESVVFLEKYPKTTIDVFVEVIQADGSTRVTGINAVSLALADAGIPMEDLVAAVSVGKIDGHLVLDVDFYEDEHGDADLPVAMTGREKKVTLLQLNGRLTLEEFKKAMEMAKEACARIYDMQKEALRRKYVEVEAEILGESR